MKLPNTDIQQLQSINVYDPEGLKIGTIDDLVFFVKDVLELSRVSVTPDKDSILSDLLSLDHDDIPIPLHFIEEFDLDKLVISLTREVVTEKMTEIAPLRENEFRYSELSEKVVRSRKGKEMGKIKNLIIEDDQLLLIIGDGFFEELLEELGLLLDTDIILNTESILDIDDYFITLDKTTDELQRILRSSDQIDEESTPPTIYFPMRTHPPF